MRLIIFLLTFFVGTIQAQEIQLQNYRFNSGGVDYYALPYSNAITVDYWARKGIFSETLIADMDRSIIFHQANSEALLKNLKGCLELSRTGLNVATTSTQESSEWRMKYEVEHSSYEQYKKAVKTGMIFGGGFIAVLLLSTTILK